MIATYDLVSAFDGIFDFSQLGIVLMAGVYRCQYQFGDLYESLLSGPIMLKIRPIFYLGMVAF